MPDQACAFCNAPYEEAAGFVVRMSKDTGAAELICAACLLAPERAAVIDVEHECDGYVCEYPVCAAERQHRVDTMTRRVNPGGLPIKIRRAPDSQGEVS